MGRFILTFFVLLLVFPFSVFAQTNQTDLLKTLLDLPAPPPTDESELPEDTEKKQELFDKYKDNSKVPPDDAPIEELLTFWSMQYFLRGRNENRFFLKPTEIVIDRIFNEIKKKPSIVTSFLHILSEKEHVEFGKDYYDELIAELDNSVANEEKTESIKSVSEAIATAERNQRKLKSGNNNEDNVVGYQITRLKGWLTYRSNYFSDDLLKKAIKIKDKGNNARYGGELISLARVDWKKAEPIVERLIDDKNQPFSATAAIAAYYLHFIQEKNERSASKYRRMLQDIVENRKAKKALRKEALETLLYLDDFEGRDDWYLSLMSDETLFNSDKKSIELRFFMSSSNPKKWVDRMLELVGHKSPIIRKVAIQNLVVLLDVSDEKTDKLILQALLPWLSDKNWANAKAGRIQLIKAYGKNKMPESIPGLILILQNERPTESEIRRGGNANYNTNSDFKIDAIKDAAKEATDIVKEAAKRAINLNKISATQSAAIEALVKFKDSRAVPALQGVLAETKDSDERETIISAILACGGYNANQQLSYLEAFAKKTPATNKSEYIENKYDRYGIKYSENEEIGRVINDNDKPDENLVRLLISRIKALKKSKPKLSNTLNTILQKWKSKALSIERLNSIAQNTADIETILKVLTNRKNLRKNHQNQIFAMRSESGVASAIAACLLENKNEMLSVLNSGNVNKKIAGLACARLLRIKLPINVVATDLNSSNQLLATAAERYLISEDSFEARRLVLTKYPNKAKILGSRWAFTPNKKANFENLPVYTLFESLGSGNYYYINKALVDLDKTQKKLREEVKTNTELLGVYAFLENRESGHQVLRLYKDKAVYSWYENEARFRERIVTKDELQQIFDYVAENEIEDLKPIFRSCHHGCPNSEFVMFGRNGGRRIFINSYSATYPLLGLKMIFNALEQGKSKLRYHLQDKIAGLEVLLDEKKILAKSLWKDGDDFRVLVFDEKKEEELEEEFSEKESEARKSIGFDETDYEDYEEKYKIYSKLEKSIREEKEERKYEPYSWRNVLNNKLGKIASQPAGIYQIKENGEFPSIDYLVDNDSPWKTRAIDFEVRVGDYKRNGIWKVSKNGLTTQVTKSDYENSLIVSSDRKWILALKNGGYSSRFGKIYRINLQTNKEIEIKLPNSLLAKPIAFIESHNKFLVYSIGYNEIKKLMPYDIDDLEKEFGKKELENLKSTYYLVDATTGSSEQVKGDFEPLSQITFRNLQKTSNENEYWAAIFNEKNKATKIGRYNTKTFKFTEELKVPEIKLNSMDIWVDEKDAMVYFVYEGHLLSLPFKKSE